MISSVKKKRLTYSQGLGVLSAPDGFLAKGYAGHGGGKNNTAMERMRNIGPIPRGLYSISGAPFTHKKCGPFCLCLDPDSANEMFGRAGFLIHGDNATHSASEGCIVISRAMRKQIVKEGYTEVEVIA